MLEDLQERVNEVEIMNELELRSVHQARNDELRLLRESYDTRLLALEKQRDQLLQKKKDTIQQNQLKIKDTMSLHLAEIHQLEENVKSRLQTQANEYCRLEEVKAKEAEEREKLQEKLQKKNEKELSNFRLQAEQKMKTQGRLNIYHCIILFHFEFM